MRSTLKTRIMKRVDNEVMGTKPLWRNKKGQSLVEITLLAPILLIALYIPADFGLALFTAHLSQNAAREGGRIASKMPTFDAAQVEYEVTKRLPFLLKSPLVTAVKRTGTSCMHVVSVTVSGTYDYALYGIIGLLGFSQPDPLAISRTTEMRDEGQMNAFTNPCP
jgi:Flp pilus assembly protein TadG